MSHCRRAIGNGELFGRASPKVSIDTGRRRPGLEGAIKTTSKRVIAIDGS
jgi:hypothetical protein